MVEFGNREKKGIIFEIERYAVHDGPGIRTVVFFMGCPLRCAWCANPESQQEAYSLMVWNSRCLGCKRCLEVCPVGALTFVEESGIQVDRKKCSGCGLCVDCCNCEALTIAGKVMSVDDVLAEVERDREFYFRSTGGVTFSGGEPFDQFPFLLELAKKAKARGLHTCVETSGYTNWHQIAQIKEHMDTFLYDLKCIDDSKHIRYTGVSNKIILQNFRKLAHSGNSLTARIPLIPGINDSTEDIDALCRFLTSCCPNCPVHILPYHRLGVSKYTRLSMEYVLREISPPSLEKLRMVKSVLERSGFHTILDG
jgi:pyruvate formate lyase activating enzyme